MKWLDRVVLTAAWPARGTTSSKGTRTGGSSASRPGTADTLLRWNHERMMRGCLTGLHDRLDAGRAAM